jgi:hypothetical protein
MSEKHGKFVNKWVVSSVRYIRHCLGVEKVGHETDLYENVTVIGGRILVLWSSLSVTASSLSPSLGDVPESSETATWRRCRLVSSSDSTSTGGAECAVNTSSSMSPRHERTSSAERTFTPAPCLSKSLGSARRARRPLSRRSSKIPLTRVNVASCSLPSPSSSPPSSSSSSSATSSGPSDDLMARNAQGGSTRRDSRSFRRRSRISLACLCFVASRVAFMARRDLFVISKSSIFEKRKGNVNRESCALGDEKFDTFRFDFASALIFRTESSS